VTVDATRLWCEHALLPDGPAERVTIDVADGRILAVAAETDPPADAQRRSGVTIPGAANTHSHVFHRALRHRSQKGHGSFWTWRDQMYAVAEALDPDRYRRLARAVFSEMVLSGFTTVGEFQYVHHQPDGTPYSDPNAIAEALTEAAVDAGIRITLLDTVYLHGGLADDGYLALYGRQRRFGDDSVEAWANRIDALATTPQRRVGAAVHSVRAVDPDSLTEVAAWAGERGAPLHAHVSEQPAENDQCLAAHGCTPIQLLERGGALGPSFTAVHATHITYRDLTLLRESGAAVCLCPTTERDLGDGVGPARRLADSGVALSIGSDSHTVIDPFEEVRAIELDERLVRGERGVFTVAELLATATAGHRLLGWHDVGEITVGQRADLVSVALDSVRTAGSLPGAVAEAVVFAATSSDVTHVMIDGVNVIDQGQHHHVDVAAEMTSAIDEIIKEADR
jgi:formiminoglutamate deiminase